MKAIVVNAEFETPSSWYILDFKELSYKSTL